MTLALAFAIALAVVLTLAVPLLARRRVLCVASCSLGLLAGLAWAAVMALR